VNCGTVSAKLTLSTPAASPASCCEGVAERGDAQRTRGPGSVTLARGLDWAEPFEILTGSLRSWQIR
jgi:hypothetical protein